MRHFRVMTTLLLVFFVLSLMPTAVWAQETEEVVLFDASASVVFEKWGDTWEAAVSIGADKLPSAMTEEPFCIQVSYDSSAEPYLVLLSWSGGESWAQIAPAYSAYGVAYYPYELIVEAYGSDFSKLDAISVMPAPSHDGLTVTKVSITAQTRKRNGISVTYDGIAGKIARSIHAGWNLGNTLDSYGDWITQYSAADPVDFETAWGNPETTREMIESVKRAGFNAIRVPVTWSQHIDDANGWKIDPVWMQRVKETVDYVMQCGLYCILNVHHDVGGESWLKASDAGVSENAEKFAAIWMQIAEEFAQYDTRLLFEGFNEILDEENHWVYPGSDAGDAVNRLNKIFVDTVRSTGGKNAERCLVINTYAAGTDGKQLDDFVLPADSAQNALIVQVHCYAPGSYCTEISDGNNLQSVWTENNGKIRLDSMLYNLYLHFTSKGIPVIIGEFGAANKDNEEDRAQWAGYLVQNAQKYGIKCFYWDGGGTMEADETLGYYKGMSLYDRYHDAWLFPKVVEAVTGVDVTACSGSSGELSGDGMVDAVKEKLVQAILVDTNLQSARVQRTVNIVLSENAD